MKPLEVRDVASTLISMSGMFDCDLVVAWENYMHPAITKNITFEEVISYINDTVKHGEDLM